MSTTDVYIALPEHQFCKMVATRRKEMDISLRYLCHKVGTSSRSYMSEVEKGRYAPSFDVGLAMCQVLDIPVPIYINFYKEYYAAKQRALMEKSYTEWFETLPEEVAINMIQLDPDEATQIHSEYYNKQYSMC